jgi:hypothetical protein
MREHVSIQLKKDYVLHGFVARFPPKFPVGIKVSRNYDVNWLI